GYEYGSFHFLEPSFLHNYTDSTKITEILRQLLIMIKGLSFFAQKEKPAKLRSQAVKRFILKGVNTYYSQ
ncbi:hypothetical protein ABND43_08095, partial [Paenibacillus larvae]